MSDKPRYYITTAITYPNGTPHVGHAYEYIATDAIARFKRPKDYVFVEALPKNNYGKILKTELRRQLEEEQRS